MARYSLKNDATIGDRCIFDNTGGFLTNVPKMNIVGEVIGHGGEDNLIVEFELQQGLIRENIPYFLLK